MPLIGNYIEFAKNPVDFIAMCQKVKGDLFTVPMVGKNLTFLLGPECSAPFYVNKDSVMSQSEVYAFMTPVFGKNVVYDAPEKKRLQQMQHMATGLRSTRLEVYVPKFEKETHDYLKQWGASGEVDILNALSELTILTSSRCLHGDDVREDLFVEVSEIYHDLDKGVTPLSFFWPGAPTTAHAKRDAARIKMVEIFTRVINARRENDAKNGTVRTDILQVFMDMKYKDGTMATTDEIVGLLIALLFAGQHTSSITSTWTVMFLLHNPDKLKKVMAEQEKVLGGDMKKPLTLELVKSMDYLYSCVKEALRMHPPLIMLMRQAMTDVKTTLNGKEYVIPKGDICITSPAVSSRMASVFPEPDAFKPERFENEGEARMTPFSYLGFGGGRHQCMGQAFGLLQVSTIVSILLRKYDFELVTPDKFPEPDYAAMVVGPKNNCSLRYKEKK
jgi:sterol 14alpha-demethylase